MTLLRSLRKSKKLNKNTLSNNQIMILKSTIIISPILPQHFNLLSKVVSLLSLIWRMGGSQRRRSSLPLFPFGSEIMIWIRLKSNWRPRWIINWVGQYSIKDFAQKTRLFFIKNSYLTTKEDLFKVLTRLIFHKMWTRRHRSGWIIHKRAYNNQGNSRRFKALTLTLITKLSQVNF